MSIILLLTLISGFCWTWVYIELIRKGFKDHAYGMPLFALGLNFGWEVIYTWLKFAQPDLDAQAWVNLLWTLFDIGIVYTYFRYGYKFFPQGRSKTEFYLWSLLVFATCFLLEYMFLFEYGKSLGARYSAFLQNLLMSVLFIDMFFKRRSMQGQSLTIAVNKWIGTLAPTILFGVIEDRPFILVIGLLCSVFDIIYIGVLYQKRKSILAGEVLSGDPEEIQNLIAGNLIL